MLAELVLFFPSATVYRQNWIMERVDQAGILAQALTGVPNYEASEMLTKDFMEQTGVELVSAKRDGMTELILGAPPADVEYIAVDMTDPSRRPLFRDTFADYFSSGNERLRVVAMSPVRGQDSLELVIPRAELRSELWAYFERILLLSLVIAIMTGTLIYLAMLLIIVRPLQRLLAGMQAFRENPQYRQNIDRNPRRKDEIGELERAFVDLKKSLRAAFRQRERLAGLGLSVAKINHDLRNVLATALLVSDRLTTQKDEKVVKMGEKLVKTIERGVGLTEDVLAYSRAETADPEPQDIRLSFLLGEVAADTMASFPGTQFKNRVPTELEVRADPDHAYRILHNLFRNAAQAMQKSELRRISVSANVTDEMTHINIKDTGPGLPERAQKNIFLAFAASKGADGSTGLGLSISKELATAQNGDLVLIKTDETGTNFQLSLPTVKS